MIVPPNHALQRSPFLVDVRTRDHRPILVTTNHSGAAMEKLFSENIATPSVLRLRDHCDCFAVEQGK
jgi:hypothetical protein